MAQSQPAGGNPAHRAAAQQSAAREAQISNERNRQQQPAPVRPQQDDEDAESE